jgi:hypothetical protein
MASLSFLIHRKLQRRRNCLFSIRILTTMAAMELRLGRGQKARRQLWPLSTGRTFSNNVGDGLFVSNIYGTAPVIVQVTDSIAAYNGISGFHVGGGPGPSSESRRSLNPANVH